MRTYSVEKRFGVSGGQVFSNTDKHGTGIGEKTTTTTTTPGFDIREVLLPGNAAEFRRHPLPGVREYLESLCYPDGSYAYKSKLAGQATAADLHGTPYAACATRLLGVGPKQETLDYIDGRNNGDGTFRGGHTRENELEGVYWCVLALKMGGREVPEESIGYVKSLRNEDGSYGLCDNHRARLKRTGQAMTILKLAGVELSPDEREKTAGYILERLDGDEGFGDIDACYGAVVSLNMLGSGITPEIREIAKEQTDADDDDALDSYEKKFKALMIRSCIGETPAETQQLLEDEERESAALKTQPFPFRTHPASFPGSAEEAYYALALRKLRGHFLRNV